MSIFDVFVEAQDKTMTGTWNTMNLFILMFLITVGSVLLNKIYKKEDYSMLSLFELGLKIAFIAVIINYVTGKLFFARQKMYKKKGFSRQRSRAQAYSDARLTQVLTMLS